MTKRFTKGEDLLEEGADHWTWGITDNEAPGFTGVIDWINRIEVYGDDAKLRDTILALLNGDAVKDDPSELTRQINTTPEIFTAKGIREIEEKYSATYVCETCIGAPADGQGMWNWINRPVAVFYQSDVSLVPEGGSQYFGMYIKRHLPDSEPVAYICNAISATEPIQGVVADDGEIIYSHYRQDYRTSKDGSVWIDGGRDYLRYDGKAPLVDLQIKWGVLCIVRGKL